MFDILSILLSYIILTFYEYYKKLRNTEITRTKTSIRYAKENDKKKREGEIREREGEKERERGIEREREGERGIERDREIMSRARVKKGGGRARSFFESKSSDYQG